MQINFMFLLCKLVEDTISSSGNVNLWEAREQGHTILPLKSLPSGQETEIKNANSIIRGIVDIP